MVSPERTNENLSFADWFQDLKLTYNNLFQFKFI